MVLDDRYQLDRLLKSGQGVETYIARDLKGDGAEVVVKILRPGAAAPALVLRMEHEAAVLSRLENSDFPLLDFGISEGTLYLVQPFLQGQTLTERLESGPLSVASTLEIAADLLSTLNHAHSLGILHRDVKPGNIIVQGGEPVIRAMLIDFGLSFSASLDPTVKREAVGTARYLAPEQAGLVDRAVDERSDLYSVGVVLYECLAGRPPFEAASVGEVLRQHLNLAVPGLRASGVEVPRALEAVVNRLLAKEPGQRYQSAAGALADVQDIAKALARGVKEPKMVIGLQDNRNILAEPAFVGRSKELAALHERLAAAAQGQGSLVFLAAESGGGKTRLLDEFTEEAARQGVWILRGQGVDHAAQRPYQLMAGVADDIEARVAAEPGLHDHLRARLGPRIEAATIALPELAGVLEGEDSGRLPEAYGEVRSLSALSTLLEALGTARRPALVLLDDCQWTDGLTAKLLEQWCQRTRPGSNYVMIVAAFRSEEVPPEHPLRSVPAQEEIVLRPLTPVEVADMAQSMAGALPSEVIQTVIQLAEGSPFMAAAVLMGLVESGAVADSGNGWVVDERALADAQTSRRAAIFLLRRLQLLQASTLHLLSVGSVLGKDFALNTAASLAGLDIEDALRGVVEAAWRRIVWIDSGYVHFVHDKIREALLSTLGDDERTELHLRAAEHIEGTDSENNFELAYHFDAAGAGERALPYALAAARHARRQHTLEIAEAHYRMADRAASQVRDREAQIAAAEGLADVLTLRGYYDEAVTHFRRALDMAEGRRERATLEGKLGDVAFKQGDMVGARMHLEGALRQLKARMPRNALLVFCAILREVAVQALHTVAPRLFVGRRRLDPDDEVLLAIRMYSRLAYVYWFHSGKIRCGWAHLREMNLAERYPPSLELAQAYSEHAPVMTMIPWFSRGLDYAERSLAIRTELGDVWGQGQSLSFEGVGLYAGSRYEDAIERCREARQIMERTGDRWEVNTAGWNIAFAQYRLGDLRGAINTARDVYAAAMDIGDQAAAGIALSAWSRASDGRVPAELIADQLNQAELEDASTSVEVHLAEAVRLLDAGEIQRATEVLRRARSIQRRAGLRQEYVAPILPWLATALRRHAQQIASHSAVPRWQMLQSLRTARKAVRLARSYRNNLPHALRELAMLLAIDGRPRTARRHFEKSLNEARRQSARYEEALTLEAMGHVGVPLGWPGAQTCLDRGVALLSELRESPREASGANTLSLADRFSTLIEVGRAIASASEPEGVYEAVRQAALTMLWGEQCVVLDMHGRATGSVMALEDHEILSRTLIERAVEENGPVVMNLGDTSDATESLVLSGVRSVLCAPIAAKDGFTKACFYVTHAQIGGLFGEEEIRLASFIAMLAGAALDNMAGSEARFTSLAQNSSDVISIVGAQGLIDYQSSSVARVFGFQPLEMMGSRLTSWIHPDEAPDVIATMRMMLDENRSHDRVECRMRASDGTWRYTETTLTNLVDDPSVRGVVLNTRDVTERKRMEAERRLDEEALRLSQRQLAAAQRIGHFGSFQWEIASDQLTLSDELHRIFAIPATDGFASMDVYRERLHPNDRDRVSRRIRTALKRGGEFEMEHRIVRPDGATVVLQVRGEVVQDDSGRPVRMQGVAQDVTEQKRVEDALRVSEDRARAAMAQALEASRLKSQFLATMSHEIRTPMNGVLGMAHLLLDTRLTDNQRRYLLALQESGTSLLEIINDILDFSKVEAGKVELEFIDFALRETVQASVALFSTSAHDKGLDLIVEIDPAVPNWVNGDPVRIRQVLTNLTSNAVKFTDRGRVTVLVEPGPQGQTRFSVSDTGIGIAPEAARNLFDPFVQADASTTRRFGGTGLGLAISHQLVQLMQGEFGYDSEEGDGSTFWFQIPLAPAVQERIVQAEDARAGANSNEVPTDAGRVLLVEDSEVNQMVATGMLKKIGYRVAIARNGSEAVEMAAAEPYDAILMDCLMPVMDGYEATGRIRRAEGPNRQTPIIALTASAMDGDRERCLKAGMDDYLAKPLDPTGLEEALAHMAHPARSNAS